LREAEDVLEEAISYAKNNEPPFNCCMGGYFSKLTMLKLKQQDIQQARHFCNERRALRKKMDLDEGEDNGFLLIAEGSIDLAMEQAQQALSTDQEVKLNKSGEITALISLSQAWCGKGDGERARDFLARARTLMEATGCWREKDRFHETESIIASAQS
jgi:hypothetical protein